MSPSGVDHEELVAGVRERFSSEGKPLEAQKTPQAEYVGGKGGTEELYSSDSPPFLHQALSSEFLATPHTLLLLWCPKV